MNKLTNENTCALGHSVVYSLLSILVEKFVKRGELD